jgi:LytS/YehU family sensor histidine kinase
MERETIVAIAIIIIAVCILVGMVIRYVRSIKKRLTVQSETIRKLQEQQREKLEFVESALNPHLFKNILNSIQSHAYQTYFALDKLANVLDYILYESRRDLVTPKDEINFVHNLIEINKIKVSPLFDLQIKSKINVDDKSYLQLVMAPLITIDLIENAFKHADIQSSDSFIKIIIELQEGIFSMTVANKVSEKPPLPKQRTGIGIKTLDQRLQLIYGAHASIDRVHKEDQYIAQLKIRLRDYKTEMRSA